MALRKKKQLIENLSVSKLKDGAAKKQLIENLSVSKLKDGAAKKKTTDRELIS